MTTSIAVASGKGGVGKTSIAVNLALTLSRLGSRVALLDADFGLANSHILLGLNPKKTIHDILIGGAKLQEALTSGPLGLKFISGGSGLTEVLNLEKSARYELIRTLDVLQDTVDVLVVDVPAGASDSAITFSSAVDRLLVVLVGEPTSFMDAYTFIKAAHMEAGISNFSIAVNMVDSEQQAVSHFKKFQDIVGRFLSVNLHYSGSIPFSRRLRRSVVVRRPIMLAKDDSIEYNSFLSLAKAVRQAPKNEPKGVSFFSHKANNVKDNE